MPTADQDFPDTGDERNRATGPAADLKRQAVLRQQVARARAHVRRVVNAADPEGLLDLGAPADEYDPEVEDLTRLVQHGDVTTKSVQNIWERWFGSGNALQRNPALLEHLTQQLRREHLDTDDQVSDVIDGDRFTDSSGRVWARKHRQWLSPHDAGKLLKRGGAVACYGTTRRSRALAPARRGGRMVGAGQGPPRSARGQRRASGRRRPYVRRTAVALWS